MKLREKEEMIDEKYQEKTTLLFVTVLIISTCMVTKTYNVSAAGKKTYYSGCYLTQKKDTDKIGKITKVTFTKKKMTVKGSLRKANSKKDVYDGNTTYLKSKKRTFKLSSKVKFYSSGGTAGEVKMSKKEFVKFCKQLNKEPNSLGFEFIVKKGKVVKAVISS